MGPLNTAICNLSSKLTREREQGDKKAKQKPNNNIKKAEIEKGDVFVTSPTQSVVSLLAVKPFSKESISLKTM